MVGGLCIYLANRSGRGLVLGFLLGGALRMYMGRAIRDTWNEKGTRTSKTKEMNSKLFQYTLSS